MVGKIHISHIKHLYVSSSTLCLSSVMMIVASIGGTWLVLHVRLLPTYDRPYWTLYQQHSFILGSRSCIWCTVSLMLDAGVSEFSYMPIRTLFNFPLQCRFFSFTACSDPGIVFIDEGEDQSNLHDLEAPVRKLECGICNIQRPRTASHCFECGVCVENLDHHCPVRSLLWKNFASFNNEIVISTFIV